MARSKSRKSRLLVPITSTSPDSSEELALSLCEGYGADLYLLNPIVVPDQTPLTLSEEWLEEEREIAGEVLSILVDSDPDVDVTGGVRVGHSLRRLLIGAASEYGVDLVVLDVDAFSEGFELRRRDIRRIAREVPCDVIVVSGTESLDTMRTVLVPIAGGPHSELAVDVAVALAAARDVWPDVLHVISPLADGKERDVAEGLLADAVDRFPGERADDWLLEEEDVADAIVREAAHYDLTIIGTPERNRLKRFFFGSTTDSVVKEATVPVIVAWHEKPE